ncbi:MAG: hypothetical protein QME75_14650 [Deltaproteobacteria bacterium]|nr:hypothetical protein [Desulfitobacteriaceae bacterium]MDI6854829.1 hypothetical protein [Deltaproteobacteria bacterium]
MDLLKGVCQSLDQATRNVTPEAFTRASMDLNSMKNRVRERFQELSAGEITPIIKKLTDFQPLNEAEKETVRLWMVGDAESYTRTENNFNDWLAEFNRLTGALKDFEAKPETLPNLLSVHSLLRDAMRTAADISDYLEEKSRVARFEQAIKQLNQEDAKLVAALLRAKLESLDM